MYKIRVSALIVLLFGSIQCFAQNFNNEYDLFLNSDESANAFRYNPAVLGLGHKFNASLNLYYDNNSKGIHNADILAALGNVGLAYNNSQVTERNYEEITRNYSAALGFGNKALTIGAGYNYRNTRFSNIFSNSRGSKFTSDFYSTGFLYRPNSNISISAVYRFSIFADRNFHFQSTELIAGTGIKPFTNKNYFFYADFLYSDFARGFKVSKIHSKLGVQAEVLPGLNLTGYYNITERSSTNYFGGGLNFSFGHIGLGSKTTVSGYTKRALGTLLSFNYSLEKRGNVIPEPQKNLELTLKGSFQDYYTSPVLFGLIADEKKPYHNFIKQLDNASSDDKIKGLLLNIEPLSTGRFGISGNIEEIGNALQRFKKSGKKIVAYLSEEAGIEEYYLATYADKIIMPRESYLNYGLSIDILNYKRFLEMLGISVNVFAEGKYKLTFQGLVDSTTTEGEEVVNRIMDVIYDKMMQRVSNGRKITVTDELKKELSGALNARELVQRNLIDGLGWYKDAKDELNKITGTGNLSGFNESAQWNEYWAEPKQIAVIGIYGGITTGESQAPPIIQLPIPYLGGGRTTGSQTILRQLEDAFKDKNVKAIILRVSSGGGSALASAEIYDAIKRFKSQYKKPFIVSMGDAAASGGYYVSANADKIFSDNTTVTGSIGVFFAIPKVDSLMRELNISAQNYKRGDNSDIASPYVQLNDEKIELIKKQVRYIYEEFIRSVAEGRDMSLEEVDSVAQGRVWLGSDALDKKLVDNIGGFYEAVKYAKLVSNLSGEKNIELKYFPVGGSGFYEDFLTKNIVSILKYNLLEFLGF